MVAPTPPSPPEAPAAPSAPHAVIDKHVVTTTSMVYTVTPVRMEKAVKVVIPPIAGVTVKNVSTMVHVNVKTPVNVVRITTDDNG